jgi:SAM-dependent methyltransferase
MRSRGGSFQTVLTYLRRTRERIRWEGRWIRPGPRPYWLRETPHPFVIAGFDAGWLSPGMDVLEIGCGLGHTAAYLASRGLRVVAIDFSEYVVSRARSSFGNEPNVTFRVLDVCSPTPLGIRFDVILDTGVLHNVPSPLRDAYRRNILLWSRPGTRFVVYMYVAGSSVEKRRDEASTVLVPPFELVHCEETPSQNPNARGRVNPVFHFARGKWT